ncbi:MAG: hypothetical protein AAGU12_09500 [Clostridiales bacterium]
MKTLRPLTLVFFLLCFIISLSACGDKPAGGPPAAGQGAAGQSGQGNQENPSDPASSGGQDASSISGSDTEPLTFEWGAAVTGLNWPQPLPAYYPELEVQPLISEGTIYEYIIKGPLNFLDEAGQLIPIPAEAEFYNVLDSCILLGRADGLNAVMTKDGQVLTGFLYDVDYDEGEGIAPVPTEWGGYIVLSKRTDPGDWSQKLYGLVDVRTGEEVLPFVFSHLEIYERFCFAIKDGAAMLMDIQGNSFYTFDNTNIYCAPSRYNMQGMEETLVTTDIPGIYPPNVHVPVYAFLYDGLTVYLHAGDQQPPDKITVLDSHGNHILTDTGFSNYHIPGKNLYIEKDGAITVVTSKGERADFPYTEEIRQAVESYSPDALYSDLKYEGELLTLQLRDRDLPALYLTYNKEGVLMEKRETAWEVINPHLQYAYDRQGSRYALTDESGQVIKEYPVDAYVRELGPFIIIADGHSTGITYSVENLQGQVLAQDIFVPIRHYVWDSLIIYTDANHCYRLYPDGTKLPMAAAPPVEHLYIGG